jgi:hypothetical protein
MKENGKQGELNSNNNSNNNSLPSNKNKNKNNTNITCPKSMVVLLFFTRSMIPSGLFRSHFSILVASASSLFTSLSVMYIPAECNSVAI